MQRGLFKNSQRGNTMHLYVLEWTVWKYQPYFVYHKETQSFAKREEALALVNVLAAREGVGDFILYGPFYDWQEEWGDIMDAYEEAERTENGELLEPVTPPLWLRKIPATSQEINHG